MIHDHHPHATTNVTSNVSTTTTSRGTHSSTSAHATTKQLDLRDQRIVELLELHDQGVTCVDDSLGWSDLPSGLDLVQS